MRPHLIFLAASAGLSAGCGTDVGVSHTKVVHHVVTVPAAGQDTPVSSDEGADSGTPGDQAHDDLPYIVDDTDDEDDPAASLEEIDAALSEALSLAMDTDPELAFPAIQDALSHTDGACPFFNQAYSDSYGYDYWYGPCTTTDGDSHEGLLYGIDDQPYASTYYEMNRYGWWQADYGVQMADGERFDVTGYLYTFDGDYYTGERIIYVTAAGFGMRWTGGEWADTWLGEQRSLDYVSTTRANPEGEVYFSIDGSVSTGGGRIEAVLFDDVFFHTEAYGSECASEPSGRISIRLDDDRWYDVLFDGGAYPGATVFPPDCDGCGEVWSRGESLGTVCPDLSALSDWEERPWN